MKNGWSIKRFEEVLEIRNGKGQREVESASGKYPIYGSAGNLMGMATDYICEAGTTIVGRKGNINSPIYVKTRFWNVDTAFGLAAKAGLDSKFLYYFCLRYDFSLLNRGTTIPSLVKSELLQIPIPIPPIAEQQRIVGVLDEAFAGLATAQANAEKNLQNARALFASHLQSVFTQRGKGWVEKQLSECCQIRPPKSEAREKLSDADLVSFLPMENMTINRLMVIPSQTRPLKEVAGSYTYFAEGDVLLAKITPCFENGKLGIATKLKNGIGFGSSEYFVFRPNHSVAREWIYYFLSREAFRMEGVASMGGSVGHQRVAKDFIETCLIPIPPLAEQHKIISKFNSLSEETQRLALHYERKLELLAALKKSLLNEAFTGKL